MRVNEVGAKRGEQGFEFDPSEDIEQRLGQNNDLDSRLPKQVANRAVTKGCDCYPVSPVGQKPAEIEHQDLCSTPG